MDRHLNKKASGTSHRSPAAGGSVVAFGALLLFLYLGFLTLNAQLSPAHFDTQLLVPAVVLSLVFLGLYLRKFIADTRQGRQWAQLREKLGAIRPRDIFQYETMIEVHDSPSQQSEPIEASFWMLARELQSNHKELLTIQNNFVILESELRAEQLTREGLSKKNMQDLSHQEVGAFLRELAGSVSHDINNPLAVLAFRLTQVRHALAVSGSPQEQWDSIVSSMDQAINRIQNSLEELEALAHESADHTFQLVTGTPSFEKKRR